MPHNTAAYIFQSMLKIIAADLPSASTFLLTRSDPCELIGFELQDRRFPVYAVSFAQRAQ